MFRIRTLFHITFLIAISPVIGKGDAAPTAPTPRFPHVGDRVVVTPAAIQRVEPDASVAPGYPTLFLVVAVTNNSPPIQIRDERTAVEGGVQPDEIVDPAAAVKAMTSARPSGPFDSLFFRQRGLLQLSIPRYEEAIGDFTDSLRLEPGDAATYFYRGFAYQKGPHGSFTLNRALGDLTESLRRDPQSIEPWLERSLIFQRLRRFDRATDDAHQARRIDPTDSRASALLASIAADDEITRILEKARSSAASAASSAKDAAGWVKASSALATQAKGTPTAPDVNTAAQAAADQGGLAAAASRAASQAMERAVAYSKTPLTPENLGRANAEAATAAENARIASEAAKTAGTSYNAAAKAVAH